MKLFVNHSLCVKRIVWSIVTGWLLSQRAIEAVDEIRQTCVEAISELESSGSVMIRMHGDKSKSFYGWPSLLPSRIDERMARPEYSEATIIETQLIDTTMRGTQFFKEEGLYHHNFQHSINKRSDLFDNKEKLIINSRDDVMFFSEDGGNDASGLRINLEDEKKYNWSEKLLKNKEKQSNKNSWWHHICCCFVKNNTDKKPKDRENRTQDDESKARDVFMRYFNTISSNELYQSLKKCQNYGQSVRMYIDPHSSFFLGENESFLIQYLLANKNLLIDIESILNVNKKNADFSDGVFVVLMMKPVD